MSSGTSLGLGAQDALIQAIANASCGAKTVVTVVTPGAILTPWREDVAAVLTPMMPGKEYGAAIDSVLFGDVSPSGKLAITFPAVDNEMNITAGQWPGPFDFDIMFPLHPKTHTHTHNIPKNNPKKTHELRHYFPTLHYFPRLASANAM